MRKIILGMDTSLDGVVESPEKWRFAYMSNDLQTYDMQKVNSVDGLLLGRMTYQIFAGFWPTQKHNEFGVADKMNSLPKFVVSSTLQRVEWNNSTLIKGNVEEEIMRLRNGQGGDIAVPGSITLAQWLMQRDLVDEYQLVTFPIVLGNGRRLFKDGINISLELIESKALSRGVILSRYRPAKNSCNRNLNR